MKNGVSIQASGLRNSVSLSALLDGLVEVSSADDCKIDGVHMDSRQVQGNDLFIALPGETVHGLDFLQQVVSKNVRVILINRSDERFGDDESTALRAASVVLIEIENLTAVAGEIASRYYGQPSAMMNVVGVTGTDGKTSVCHLLGQALNVNSKSCGVLGTLGWGFGNAMHSTGLTTPDAVAVQSALASMLHEGAKTVAMEVSSHALVQKRVSGIVFDVAVLTNIGRDHLDYHGNMEAYREAKQSLFYKPQLRAAVINADDEFGALLMERLPELELFSYGRAKHDGNHIRYQNIEHLASGLSFELEYGGRQYPVKSALLGGFNVQNIAATFAVLVALGVSPDLAINSLTDLKPVPGRMESTRLDNGAVIIVDYAHNPHALESVLKSISSHCEGRLVVVFGCGGDRDQGKRSIMAAIAEEFCDVCVVTDDNPRSESGDVIVEQILGGFKEPDNVIVQRDRKAAIELAMSQAGNGDFVVVAGKGHEDYQLVGDQRLPFSDSAVVADYARAIA